MVHPIFSVLISRPELVVDHVAGYAALAREEASSVGTEVAKRAVAWAVTLFALLTFLILAGVAIMLGVVLRRIPLGAGAGAGRGAGPGRGRLGVARKRLPEQAFTELKAQLEADAQALRTVGSTLMSEASDRLARSRAGDRPAHLPQGPQAQMRERWPRPRAMPPRF